MKNTSIIYGEKKRDRRKKLIYLAAGLAALGIIASAYYLRPQPEEEIARYSGDMLGALELLSIEYGEAVENGEVVKESEYEGAKEIVDRVIDQFRRMKPYAMKVNPELTLNMEGDLNKLRSMVYEKSSREDVNRLIEQITRDVKDLQSYVFS